MDIDEAKMRNSIYGNTPEEIVTNVIAKTKAKLRSFLKRSYYKKPINPIMDPQGNALYINFNHTPTLEDVYGIPESRVLHIHGEAMRKEELSLFGKSGVSFWQSLAEKPRGFKSYLSTHSNVNSNVYFAENTPPPGCRGFGVQFKEGLLKGKNKKQPKPPFAARETPEPKKRYHFRPGQAIPKSGGVSLKKSFLED